MSIIRSAFHLRTGEPSAAEAVEAWLRNHQVESVVFFDAYNACVYLLQHSAAVPDLAFVGIDWLAPDELAIIRYVRETWPAVGIVVYSSNDETPPFQAVPPALVCRTSAALLQFLTEPPAQALRRLREQATHAAARMPPAAQPSSASAAPDQVSRSDYAPPAVVPPGNVLTSDELSALLEEDDDH